MGYKISILGTRGVPSAHSGFETLAHDLSLFLRDQGWDVTVYCQAAVGEAPWSDEWQGVRRVHLPTTLSGPLGTIEFDWRSTLHAAARGDLALVLGYNTAVFSLVHRIRGVRTVMNMDGFDWKREKWNRFQRAWLYVNDWAGSWLSDHLIADHPEIERHLRRRRLRPASRISMVPYGAPEVRAADPAIVERMDLRPGGYALVIARPEPENTVLPIVRAFSRRTRDLSLVVLGEYDGTIPYRRRVVDSASEEVVFPGAIFDREIVSALRFHARLHVHGHTVGGTNPTLVEALGAGNAVLAHDNRFNRWVAEDAARYFSNEDECAEQMDLLLSDAGDATVAEMSAAARRRHDDAFRLERVLSEYQGVLMAHLSGSPRPGPRLRRSSSALADPQPAGRGEA